MFISLESENNGNMYGVSCIEKMTPLSAPDADGNMLIEFRFASGVVEQKTIHTSEAKQFDRACQHIHFNKEMN